MNFKTTAFVLGAIVIFGGLAFGVSRISTQSPSENISASSTPTQTGGESSIGIARINQGFSALGVKVTPTEILEDSRCPRDVQCIQAGTVRVKVTLESGLGTANEIFTLDKAITTEAEQITLIAVAPDPIASVARKPSDYVLTFKVEKRVF